MLSCGSPRGHLLLPRKVKSRGKKGELKLAHLHLDTVTKLDTGVDTLTTAIGAVERAKVAHREACAGSRELGMTPRNGYVIEKNINLWVPACNRRILIEQESRTKIGAATHHQQGRARRQRINCFLLINRKVGSAPANHRVEIFAELLGWAHLGLTSLVGLLFGTHVPLPPASAAISLRCISLYVIAAAAAVHLEPGAASPVFANPVL